MDRRGFLKKAAFAAAASAAPSVVSAATLGTSGNAAPSNRINLGFIGPGNRGRQILPGFLSQDECQVVAVCDVERSRRESAQTLCNEWYASKASRGSYAGCAACTDFRELIARNDIDGVVIATPDHWHVLLALAAARAGKDIYLEKPLGLSLTADHALRSEIKRRGTVFQFGTQQRSEYTFRKACELVRNGRIGSLQTVRVWSPVSRSGGSLERVPVPEGLDYDMWLGPAPYTPYTKDRCSNALVADKQIGGPPKIWPFISDYCLGWIAGWGVHPLDIAIWGAGDHFDCDVEVEGTGVFPTDGACDTATDWNVLFKYSSGVDLEFRGNPSAGDWSKEYALKGSHGTVFIGSEGWVAVKRNGITADPKSILKSVIAPNEIRLYESNNHAVNFVECMKSRANTICNIDDAVSVDTVCHLADMATQTGRKLKWKAEEERFADDDLANRMLTRAMRSPWRL